MIDFETLLILAVLAFILFGPEKLPQYAEKLGRLIAKVRAASSEVTTQFQNPFQYPPEPKQSDPPDQLIPPKRALGYITCPACQQTIGGSFTFCPHCGRRVNEEPAAAQAPSPEPQPPQPPAAS
jgi:Sec-independent protein translocase protein TatA